MIDSVKPHLRGVLLYRTLQGNFTLLLLYHAVKYLPLVQVALIINLMPLFTAIMGYYYLNERLKILEIIVLIVSFIGVAVLIVGGPNEKEKSELEQTDSSSSAINVSFLEYVIASLLLILNPIFNASGSIALRQLKGLHDYTTSAYMGISMTILYALIIWIFGMGFDFVSKFDQQAWYIVLAMGIIAVFQQTFRFKALQYDTASRLAVVNYFQTIILFLFDVVFLDQSFNMTQIIGIIIIFTVNSIKWGDSFYTYIIKKKKNA
ncbi:drug metabolite transporter permease [Stylonychia lemnae]|uniref:Drug metabolite transporter permease n=1 Tax=Stylonychia lemnae TaxID=5949 RepID=A0A078AFM0_STYLE|nr:drug metabolite transporter permease [Stylonychia lemnae]|eukprot:CDW80631.1 drug metabolite transporter permease [Stylonychia lemnae]